VVTLSTFSLFATSATAPAISSRWTKGARTASAACTANEDTKAKNKAGVRMT
jgi:hypothetical protein